MWYIWSESHVIRDEPLPWSQLSHTTDFKVKSSYVLVFVWTVLQRLVSETRQQIVCFWSWPAFKSYYAIILPNLRFHVLITGLINKYLEKHNFGHFHLKTEINDQSERNITCANSPNVLRWIRCLIRVASKCCGVTLKKTESIHMCYSLISSDQRTFCFFTIKASNRFSWCRWSRSLPLLSPSHPASETRKHDVNTAEETNEGVNDSSVYL